MQIEILNVTLDNRQKAQERDMKMTDQYFDGDLPPDFLSKMNADFAEFPVADRANIQEFFYRIFLDARTAGFHQALGKPLAEGGSFVAVGLGHLVGKNGLLALLGNDGYKLTPVF